MRRSIVLFALIAGGLALGTTVFAQELTDAKRWTAADDKNDKGSSVCALTAREETIDGQKKFVVTMSGLVTKQFAYGFILVTYEMDPPTRAKIAAGKKIKFKVLGDGEFYKLRLDTTDVKDYDNHIFTFMTKKDKVVEVSADLTQFNQEGWGKPVPLNRENIAALTFQTLGQPHETVSLKVFDFRIE